MLGILVNTQWNKCCLLACLLDWCMNQPVQTKQYWDGKACLSFRDFEWAEWLAQASWLLSCPILKSDIWITALDSIQDAWYFVMWTEQDCKPNFPTVYILFSVWRTSNYSSSTGEKTAVLPWTCENHIEVCRPLPGHSESVEMGGEAGQN